MQTYKLTIEYDGTGLLGWQKQKEDFSVQGCIEQAIYKFCQQNIDVFCSGRTDAGVHALGQVASISFETKHSEYQVKEAINFYLRRIVPKHAAISILSIELSEPDFHARFSAKRRYYQYRIINRRSQLTIGRKYSYHVAQELNVDKMQDAATALIGTHDFSSFRAAECQAKSPVKSIDEIKINQSGELITFDINAQSFLHHQIRNIVGTLVQAGKGKWTKRDVERILAAKDRRKAGATAPAHGLYFMKVDY
jgi:tRNA pseudouridine38-40 synthase